MIIFQKSSGLLFINEVALNIEVVCYKFKIYYIDRSYFVNNGKNNYYVILILLLKVL